MSEEAKAQQRRMAMRQMYDLEYKYNMGKSVVRTARRLYQQIEKQDPSTWEEKTCPDCNEWICRKSIGDEMYDWCPHCDRFLEGEI